MAIQAKRGSARIHEALARDPELAGNLADLWRKMPEEYKFIAISIYADKIFEALPKDLSYGLFECGWSWLSVCLEERENDRKKMVERKNLLEAKRAIASVRKMLKEIKQDEQRGG